MEKKDSVLPTEPSDLTSEPSKTRGRELEKGRSATITAAAPPAVVSADATEGKGRQKRSMTVGTKAAHRPLSQSQTQPTSPLSAQPSGKPSEAGKKESHRSTRHHKDSGRHLRHHSNKKQAKQKATDGGDDGNDANDANNNNSNNHSTVPKKPLITPIEVKLATDVSAEPTNNSNVTTTTTTTVIHAGDIASVADIDSNGWGILIAENVRTWADLKEVLSPEDFAVITSAGSKFDYKKSFEKNQSAMTSPPPKQEEEEEEGKVTQKELSVWLKSKRLPYSMLVERGIVIEGSVTGPLETQKRLWKSDSIAKIDVMLGVSDSGGESKKDGDEGKAWQEPLSARGTSDSRIAPRRRKFTFVGEEMGIKRIMSSKTLKISDPRKQDERRPAERCSKQHIEEDTKKKQTTTTTTTTVKRKEDTKRKSNRKHGNKHKHQSDKKKLKMKKAKK